MNIEIDDKLYENLIKLGLIPNEIRLHNVGKSDYSKHTIQPWSIWIDYNMDPWDADITKRVCRTKEEPGMSWKEARIMDYEKIIHNCQEKIRQLKQKTMSVVDSQEAGSIDIEDLSETDFSNEIIISKYLNYDGCKLYEKFKEEHEKCNKQHFPLKNPIIINDNYKKIYKIQCPCCKKEQEIPLNYMNEIITQ